MLGQQFVICFVWTKLDDCEMYGIHDETTNFNNKDKFWGNCRYKDFKVVNNTVENMGVKYQTNYGKNIINCNDYKNLKVQWSIKILNQTSLIIIGLTNNTNFPNYCYLELMINR